MTEEKKGSGEQQQPNLYGFLTYCLHRLGSWAPIVILAGLAAWAILEIKDSSSAEIQKANERLVDTYSGISSISETQLSTLKSSMDLHAQVMTKLEEAQLKLTDAEEAFAEAEEQATQLREERARIHDEVQGVKQELADKQRQLEERTERLTRAVGDERNTLHELARAVLAQEAHHDPAAVAAARSVSVEKFSAQALIDLAEGRPGLVAGLDVEVVRNELRGGVPGFSAWAETASSDANSMLWGLYEPGGAEQGSLLELAVIDGRVTSSDRYPRFWLVSGRSSWNFARETTNLVLEYEDGTLYSFGTTSDSSLPFSRLYSSVFGGQSVALTDEDPLVSPITVEAFAVQVGAERLMSAAASDSLGELAVPFRAARLGESDLVDARIDRVADESARAVLQDFLIAATRWELPTARALGVSSLSDDAIGTVGPAVLSERFRIESASPMRGHLDVRQRPPQGARPPMQERLRITAKYGDFDAPPRDHRVRAREARGQPRVEGGERAHLRLDPRRHDDGLGRLEPLDRRRQHPHQVPRDLRPRLDDLLVVQRRRADPRGVVREARQRADAQPRRPAGARLRDGAHPHRVGAELREHADLGRGLVRRAEHRGVDAALEGDLARGGRRVDRRAEPGVVGRAAALLGAPEGRAALEVQVVLDPHQPGDGPGLLEAARRVREQQGARAERRRGAHARGDLVGVSSLVEVHAPLLREHARARELAEHEAARVPGDAAAGHAVDLLEGDRARVPERLGERAEAGAEHDQHLELREPGAGHPGGQASLERLGRRHPCNVSVGRRESQGFQVELGATFPEALVMSRLLLLPLLLAPALACSSGPPKAQLVVDSKPRNAKVFLRLIGERDVEGKLGPIEGDVKSEDISEEFVYLGRTPLDYEVLLEEKESGGTILGVGGRVMREYDEAIVRVQKAGWVPMQRRVRLEDGEVRVTVKLRRPEESAE